MQRAAVIRPSPRERQPPVKPRLLREVEPPPPPAQAADAAWRGRQRTGLCRPAPADAGGEGPWRPPPNRATLPPARLRAVTLERRGPNSLLRPPWMGQRPGLTKWRWSRRALPLRPAARPGRWKPPERPGAEMKRAGSARRRPQWPTASLPAQSSTRHWPKKIANHCLSRQYLRERRAYLDKEQRSTGLG